MNNIMDFWRNEWAAVTDVREVSNILSNDFSPIREVVVVLTNNITGTYEARSYPNDDYDGNGMIELYEFDVYEILIKGADENGNSIVKKWEAPRFMHIGTVLKILIPIIKIEAATPPDIRSRFTREVHPSEL